MDKRALGEKIRTLRDKAGLTQIDLAGEAKIAHRALQRLESGEANPTLETLESVAKALKCNVIDFWGPKERLAHEMAKAQIQERNDFRSAADLLSTFAGLSARRQAVIRALIYKESSTPRELPGPLAQIFQALLKALEEERQP